MATDAQIRQAVAGLIATAQPDAQVYSWGALAHEKTDWPGLFRGDGVTHGWIVKRASVQSKLLPGGRSQDTAQYDVWGFYGFRANGSAGDNSDEEFAVICDGLRAAIAASSNLGLAGGVRNHDLLQFLWFTTFECGEEALHFAQGRLAVHLCC